MVPAGKPSRAEQIDKKLKELEAKEQNGVLTASEIRDKDNLKKGTARRTTERSTPNRGLFDDVLTDADGISFHRFQMFVWTIVLAIVFISEVWQRIAMPEFNATLLALMGISSGTFLGFMIKETHSADQARK